MFSHYQTELAFNLHHTHKIRTLSSKHQIVLHNYQTAMQQAKYYRINSSFLTEPESLLLTNNLKPLLTAITINPSFHSSI